MVARAPYSPHPRGVALLLALLIAVALPWAAGPAPVRAATYTPVTALTDGSAYLGESVVVSADGQRIAATVVDGVRVWRRDGGSWTLEASLTADPNGRHALSFDATAGILTVAERSATDLLLFARDGESWSLLATLDSSVSNGGNPVTGAISADGSTAVLGMAGASSGAGRLYVFTRPGGGWTDTSAAAATLSSGDAGTAFLGWSTAISADGGIIVSGAPNTAPSSQGGAWVWVRPGGGWADATASGRLTAATPRNSASHGSAVAISADGATVAVGADGDLTGGTGAIRVYRRPGGGWATGNESALLRDARASVLGQAVAISADGGTVVGGAPYTFNNARGAAFVFRATGGAWSGTPASAALLEATTGTSYANLGWGVGADASGGTIAAGEPYGAPSDAYGRVRIWAGGAVEARVDYGGPYVVNAPLDGLTPVRLSAIVSPATAGCEVRWELSSATGGPAGSVTGTSGTDGTAIGATTLDLTTGIYSVAVSFVSGCDGPGGGGTLTIAPGTAPWGTNGGGWYRAGGTKVSFGHVVSVASVYDRRGRTVGTTTQVGVDWSVRNAWRLKSSYTTSSTDGTPSPWQVFPCASQTDGTVGTSGSGAVCGSVLALGQLAQWDAGRKTWKSAQTVRYRLTVYDGGSVSVCTDRRTCRLVELPDWIGLTELTALDGTPIPGVPGVGRPIALVKPVGSGSIRSSWPTRSR